MAEIYKQILQQCIHDKDLSAFYPPTDPRLDSAASRAAAHIENICTRWEIPLQDGRVLAKLALFDILLYIDNSGSMRMHPRDHRIEDLRYVVKMVVDVAKVLDGDGFDVRFMNGPKEIAELGEVKDEAIINRYLDDDLFFQGITPLGTELRSQVLNGIVARAEKNDLPKPVLVITITDGEPLGEPQRTLHEVISNANKRLKGTKYGSSAVSYQFAQVGSDSSAQEFLERLDSDDDVGSLVDCTSGFEFESMQMSRAVPRVVLTKSLWLLKLLVGAIDSSYDGIDEAGSRSGGHNNHSQSSARDDGRRAFGQRRSGEKADSKGSQQLAIPEGPPPSYDDSIQPPRQGFAEPSSPRRQGLRSILSRSKEVLGRARSFRGSKGS